MPQLDFSVFPSQLFWLCITFFAMLFIMSRFIIPKTAEMINLRKEKIDGYLEKAAELKEKVEKTLDKYNQALQEASDEAAQSLQKTQQELDAMIERRQADLAAELNRQITEGEKKIAAGKDKAMRQVEEISADLALDVLKKLGFNHFKAKDVNVAMKQSGEN